MREKNKKVEDFLNAMMTGHWNIYLERITEFRDTSEGVMYQENLKVLEYFHDERFWCPENNAFDFSGLLRAEGGF